MCESTIWVILQRTILDEKTSSGRKLDFLNQELHREVNTIGSKANDAELASLVVEMKTLIERMRDAESKYVRPEKA